MVDRWGKVRGRFNWKDAADEVAMLGLIDRLWDEKTPGEYLKEQDQNPVEEE